MRTSLKTVLIAIIILAILMIAAIVFGRFIVFEKDERPRGPMVSEAFNFEDFNAVVITGGAWEALIEQDNEFYVEAAYPKHLRDDFDIQVQQNTLIIDSPRFGLRSSIKTDDQEISSKDSRRRRLSSGNYKAKIKIPSLVSIKLDGVEDVVISGFNEESLDIAVEGASKIYAENSSADRLNVSLDGVGQADLRDLLAVDANVSLNGAGELLLNMNGGVLQGSLDGIGAIRYKGDVLREEIEVNGLGEVVDED